ncbi:MAG: ftsW [Gammaproteobacteria bacterium]|nr:ftsW [Gammaproteobacteria bacterium]
MNSILKKTKMSKRAKTPVLYDRTLLLAVSLLIGVGILMVASASTVIADQQYGNAFHYVYRQLFYLFLGVVAAIILLKLPTKIWLHLGPVCLLLSFILLIAVLIPGIGHSVNGSRRWLGIGPFGFQVSELAKLSFILYMAGYLVRQADAVKTKIGGFIKPMIVVSLLGILLLGEPDFGAAVVITATALGLLFLAGVRLSLFFALVVLVAILLSALAISSPYRMARLTSFLHPWANQFDSGYQLTQSLIAFGRGGWLGVGLGDSIQKLFYLPEAHTDFLFAVLTEELGLAGALFLLLLFGIIVTRAFQIGRRAWFLERSVQAYMGYGFGLWIGLQTLINLGVNMGVLPTKGLTLPFVSYGGSSLLINCIVMAILLRMDHENRMIEFGLAHKSTYE